jgi:hypothetical protein
VRFVQHFYNPKYAHIYLMHLCKRTANKILETATSLNVSVR